MVFFMTMSNEIFMVIGLTQLLILSVSFFLVNGSCDFVGFYIPIVFQAGSSDKNVADTYSCQKTRTIYNRMVFAFFHQMIENVSNKNSEYEKYNKFNSAGNSHGTTLVKYK